MRLRFLPLALCLMVVFSSQICFANSSIITADINSKSLDLVAFKAAAKKEIAPKITAEEVHSIPNYFTPKTYLAHSDVTPFKNRGIFHIEEFSYKKIDTDYVSSAILTNSKAEIVEVMASATTFRQGMFYGFAIMVILLNLVCYFLFEEKLFMNYSLAMAAMTALFFYSDGLFAMIGMENGVNNNVLSSFLILMTSVLATVFASNYLTINETFPKLRWVSYLVFWCSRSIIPIGCAFRCCRVFTHCKCALF